MHWHAFINICIENGLKPISVIAIIALTIYCAAKFVIVILGFLNNTRGKNKCILAVDVFVNYIYGFYKH